MYSAPLRRCCHWYPNFHVEKLCPLSSGSAVTVACRAETAESSDSKGKSGTSGFFKNWKATAVGFFMGCWVPLTAFFVAAPDKSEDLEHRLLERGTHDPSLAAPGELVNADFRDAAASAKAWKDIAAGRPVRVVQWNIERGLEFEAILATLKQLQADVLLIQEVDNGCDRSEGRDVGMELAQELKMAYSFVSEFVEFRSPARDSRSQGGGIHGNAILSHLPLTDVEVIEHLHHPVDWNNSDNYFSRREPRTGRRLTLAGQVHTPAGRIQVYSAHLEVFCGAFSRLRQFADILTHSRESKLPMQIIGGDLNTMGHGIARFSPYHCTDRLRWATLGQEEAAFWVSHLFSIPDPPVHSSDPSRRINEKLWEAGLRDEAACRALTNPGFIETFPLTAPTLDHPSYRVCGIPLMNGKLDWLLHRGGLTPVDTALGNDDYSASDHKWLAADFCLPGSSLHVSPASSRRHSSETGTRADTSNTSSRSNTLDTKPPLSMCT